MARKSDPEPHLYILLKCFLSDLVFSNVIKFAATDIWFFGI